MRKYIYILPAILLIAACGKKSTPLPQLQAPDKVNLTFPAQNSACTTGTVISATNYLYLGRGQ